jgi:hypothetical protein
MTLLMQAVGMIQQALNGLPPGSPMHRDALQAATRLSRHVQQGQPTAGVQQTQLQDLLRNVIRNALTQRIMSQQQGPMGGGAAPGAGGPSPVPQVAEAPSPSTALPGA